VIFYWRETTRKRGEGKRWKGKGKDESKHEE
jgi:hypothetical protein